MKPSSVEFLSDYHAKWNAYLELWTHLQDVFAYLDRYWIKQNTDYDGSSASNIYYVFNLSLVVWREHVFSKVKEPLFKGVMGLLTSERQGQAIDHSLVRGIVQSYEKLGANLPNPLSLYKEEFERGFLEQTLGWYRQISSTALAGTDVQGYMSQVEKWLDDEHRRGALYLESSSIIELKRACEAALIGEHKDVLYGEVDAMLRTERIDDLYRMYRLLSRTEKGLQPMQDALRRHVERQGTQTVQALDANAAKDPKVYMETVWRVYRQASDLVQRAFSKDPAFTAALEQACRKFMNLNPRSAELLAKHCHTLLEKGPKTISDTELDESLANVNSIFRFIDNKDVFQAFYSKMLARRLIHHSSVSDDAEEQVIKNLKHTCGYEYTSKLQRMFTDRTVSRDVNNRFQAHLRQHLSSKTSPSPDISLDFHVLVLTAGAWPLSPQTTTFNLPAELSKCVQVFNEFYHGQHSGRKVSWLHHLSKGDLRLNLEKQKYELQTSTYHMAVLLLFNGPSVKPLTYEYIQSATGLTETDLKRTLETLVKSRLLLSDESSESTAPSPTSPTSPTESDSISSSSCFLLNLSFSSKRTKIKVSASSVVEPSQESEVTHKAVDEDRKMAIQAAIVRIMKSRKELQHNALVSETIELLQHNFQPRLTDVKTNIDALIDKEYMARSENDRNLYRYVA
mmetsp:Transcript_3494/g.5293  ORF Transcript_3494/g.5293 Transcript_3494/m.5293 type:complete len:680 (-) Transcript_3494:367-2406(-)